ncbi:hypothetical protein DFA_07200 [Cavenderia fasciculata]|uniref:Uncharacterized protein n=1 Tax=Cavenderia fasciculata TaxID=261658 RepID=F4PVR9_CACFS|nr:uncharacterized protein DFA_07200 [Cavenderia fasciculata]EGG20083.1 hypothetical protein DFA_07200 [Cavenderia fasciculata]|eukprot:XP_004367066.1 hypothetical protein DFA_07200 [Cavenderia fasciculata]
MNQVISWLIYLVSPRKRLPTTDYISRNTNLLRKATLDALYQVFKTTVTLSIWKDTISDQVKQKIKEELLADLNRDNKNDQTFLNVRIASSVAKLIKENGGEWNELDTFKNDSSLENDAAYLLSEISKFGDRRDVDEISKVNATRKKQRKPVRSCDAVLESMKMEYNLGSADMQATTTSSSTTTIQGKKKDETMLVNLLKLDDYSRNQIPSHDIIHLVLSLLDSKPIQDLSDTILVNIQSLITQYNNLDCTKLVTPLVQLFKPPHFETSGKLSQGYQTALNIIRLACSKIDEKNIVSDAICQLFEFTILENQSHFSVIDMKDLVQYAAGDSLSIYLPHFTKYIYSILDDPNRRLNEKDQDDKDKEYDGSEEEDEEEDEDEEIDEDEEYDGSEEEEEDQVERIDPKNQNCFSLLDAIIKVVPPKAICPYAKTLATSISKHENISSLSIIPQLLSVLCNKESGEDGTSVALEIFEMFELQIFKKIEQIQNNGDDGVGNRQVSLFINLSTSLCKLIRSMGANKMNDSLIMRSYSDAFYTFGHLQLLLHNYTYGEVDDDDNGQNEIKRIQLLGVSSGMVCTLIGILEENENLTKLSKSIGESLFSDIQDWETEQDEGYETKLLFYAPLLVALKKYTKGIVVEELDDSWIDIKFLGFMLGDVIEMFEQFDQKLYSKLHSFTKMIIQFCHKYISFIPLTNRKQKHINQVNQQIETIKTFIK